MSAFATALCALLVSPGARARRATTPSVPTPKRPHVVLVILDELPGDTLLGPNGRIDAGRYPQLRGARGRQHLVPQRVQLVRLDDEGRAADPRRHRSAARHGAGGARPSALALHGARETRLPDRLVGGGELALPAAPLPRRPAPEAGDHPAAEARPRRALGSVGALDPRHAAPDALDEARAAAARTLGLPALRTEGTAGARRAPARDADRARLLRRLPHAPQRAAPAAPARLRRPPARPR